MVVWSTSSWHTSPYDGQRHLIEVRLEVVEIDDARRLIEKDVTCLVAVGVGAEARGVIAHLRSLICSTKNQIRTLICHGLLYPLRNISIAHI
jgi:hypothetical protein